MTTEQEELTQQEDGFSSGFKGEELKAIEKPPEATPDPMVEKQVEEVKQEAAEKPSPSLTAEDIAAFRAAASELPNLKSQLRDANGRIGALNDLLKQTREQKKEEGKAPVLTSVELKRMKEQFPELAESLNADIGELVATLAKPQDKEEVTKLIREQVAELSLEDRKQMLSDEHPDWEDLKNGQELWDWVGTLSADKANAFKTSMNPLYVAKQLTAFKTWRDAQKADAPKAKDESQERLEAAITPKGVPRTSKSTMSDEEAMMKGFSEGFNS